MQNSDIYFPDEDSYLMSEVLEKKIPKLLKKNSEIKLLEIGCGSGINLQTALKCGIKKENIFGSDINESAVNLCRNLGFNCINSDLFEKIPRLKFDLIVFNPPYLPLDRNEPKDSRISTTGGKKGNEITIKFLKQAKNYLNRNGKIFLITSSLPKKIDFNNYGYENRKIAEKKLFFERLSLNKLELI